MKARIWLITVFIFQLNTIKSQNIENLLSRLNTAASKEEIQNAKLNLAFSYQKNQAYSKAIDYYQSIIKDASENDWEFKIKIYKNLVFCNEQLNIDSKVIEYQNAILELQTKHADESEAIKTMEAMSTSFISMKKYTQALSLNETILSYYTKNKDEKNLAFCYNNLGYLKKQLNSDSTSIYYFNLCKQIINKSNSSLKTDDKIKILMNLGLIHTEIGSLAPALSYFNQAYELSLNEKNPIETANVINYLAAYDFKIQNYKSAEEKLLKSISITEKIDNDIKAKNVLLASYKIYCELLFATEKYGKFRAMNANYNALKDQILQSEKLQNHFLAQQQIDIEKRENQVKEILAQKEKQDMLALHAEAENEKLNQHYKLKVKELVLLKKEQEIQQIQLVNQRLEREKLANLLKITKEEKKNDKNRKQIELLKKEQMINRLSIAQKKKNIELLNLQKYVASQKLNDAEMIRNYVIVVLALLMTLFVIIIFAYRNNLKKNKQLIIQQQIIEERNTEIVKQNLELHTKNAEMEALGEELSQQNEALSDTQKIVSSQNEKLKEYNESLETMVEERTFALKQTNEQLIQHSNQLEQFTFIISHNIRAPLARLLGLTYLLKFENIEDKNVVDLLSKVQDCSSDLDVMIHDLNRILEIKKGLSEIYINIKLMDTMVKVTNMLEKQIVDSNASISTDFSEVSEIYSVAPYIDSIFYNLISNSLKYRSMKRNPVIEISTKLNEDSFIQIKFKDNGMGIDLEKNSNKVFGLYQRFHDHTEGKGMGLYLVKTQIQALGGDIKLSGKVNTGLTIRIRLPGTIMLK